MKSNETKNITSKELKSVFWRSFLLPSCYSMDRMQAPGFAYSMITTLKKLYGDDKEKYAEALSRHSEVYNNTFACSPFVLGIASAMEEEAANDPNFDVSTINSVKVALMGPLSGIGDTFFWGTFRILGAGIGVSFAQQGSILGPILFFIIYNIPNLLVRVFGLKYGYKLGGKAIDALAEGGLMKKATEAATVLGLVVIGGMIASMVNIKFALNIQMGNDVSLSIQSIFDEICPKIIPLLSTFGVYYALKKNVKPTTVMIFMIVIAIVFKFFGIM